MNNTRISFIGCGNMGRSLIGGLLANGHERSAIVGGEPDHDRAQQLNSVFSIDVYTDNNRAIENADVVILAVKPQVLLSALDGIRSQLKAERPLIISIAAGVRISALEEILGVDYPIVRVMPNTPALIQAGASALFANQCVSGAQRELAEEIMRSVGLSVWLDREDLMDTVTALSGSGPAYFFLIMEVLEKAAIRLGLPPGQARLLTLETAFGAAKMALESEADAATLRHQVTSPGGTTEQALKVLMEQGDIERLFMDALSAAKERSLELADAIGKVK
jgi:pyrroline-5-carboxylate reductase